MPFLYEFTIDTEKVEGQIGFSTSRKWEEALDEATLVIPFTYESETPYKMFSILSIDISEIDNYTDRNTIDTREYEFIIYSDNVKSLGSYGYYRHQVNAIEYTAKLDYYMINNLSKSRSVLKDTQAPFETHEISASSEVTWFAKVTLEDIGLKENFYANRELELDTVYQAYVASSGEVDGFKRTGAVIRTNATLVSGTSPHTLSSSSATWVFPAGEWEIEYGFIADGTEGYSYDIGFNPIYTFYVEAIDQYELSMYDVINDIRDSVSKYGGIEDTVYYDVTRIFDIDSSYEDYLKSVQAPQIYLNQATARQMLIYALSFVNMLPRLELGTTIDNLTFEEYNLSNGTFIPRDVIAYGGHQNTNQIGTRNYQPITQALANNLDDTSVHSPSRSGYQQVRSLDIQLTADNFTIKLPEKSPLYMPKKLVVVIPYIKIYSSGGAATVRSWTDFELDITPRWINEAEWKLKDITTNFPTITSRDIWDNDLGLREYKVENLTWQVGDTHINLATIFGTLFEDNLIRNVVKMAIYEYTMLHPPVPILTDGSFDGNFEIDIDIPAISEYKDWRFRVEYITDERLVIKQEKEDLEQVSFYSEMRQNQEQALVNIVRQSRKGYGDLQRTGNVTFSFPKKHTSLDEFYEVGQKDSDNYTITQIDTQWYNDYAIATYHITKYHNRIQQATFVNQKYRPFDNYAKSVLNRHEHYGDYLIALPPTDTDSGVQEQDTKIYSNDNTVRRITEILLGNDFGLPTKATASVALIRTDGMLDAYPEGSPSNKRYFIVSPLTSRGVKGGFAFTLGFKNNQVAGDGLVSETVGSVTTYYNEAVRYTDKKGRFTRFGFAIMEDLDFDSVDDLTFPLIENLVTAIDTYFEDNAYFWCGYYYDNVAFAYPLVWNKDPMTNAQLTYQLNVVSYYIGLYIFGLKFFTDNYIVREHDILNGAVLYLYTDSTRYEMFEDLFVKSGYDSSVALRDNEIFGDGNIEYDHIENTVLFVGISMTSVTSWAIGITNENGDIELLLACNEGLSGVKFVNRHFRPNVLEIGNRTLVVEYINLDFALEFSEGITYVRGREVPLTSDIGLIISNDLTYVRGTELLETLDTELTLNNDLVYRASKDIGDTLDIEMRFGAKLKHFVGDSIPIEMDFGVIVTGDMTFVRGDEVQSTMDLALALINDMTYVRGTELAETTDIALVLTNDIVHYASIDIGATTDIAFVLSNDIVHRASKNIGDNLDIEFILTNDVTYVRGDESQTTLDIPMVLTTRLLHFVGESTPMTMDSVITFNGDMVFFKDIELTIEPSLVLSGDFTFDIDKVMTVDLGLVFGGDFTITKQIELTMDSNLVFSNDIQHRASKDIGDSIDMGMLFSNTVEHYASKDIGDNVDAVINFVFDIQYEPTLDIGDTLDIPMSLSFDIQYIKYEPQYATPVFEVGSGSLGTDGGGDYYYIMYRVKNDDTATGRVGHGVATVTPSFITTNMLELTAGEWSDWIETQGYYTSGTPKLYAQTRDVLGEDDKEVSEIAVWDSWS